MNSNSKPKSYLNSSSKKRSSSSKANVRYTPAKSPIRSKQDYSESMAYLESVKKKAELTLSNKGVKLALMEENDISGSEEESCIGDSEMNVKELIKKLQLKNAIQRQEMGKLRNLIEKKDDIISDLEKKSLTLEARKEKENKYMTSLERELSAEKKKNQQIELKLKKINPIETVQLFQEIMSKNQELTRQKEELEIILKRMLLEKELKKENLELQQGYELPPIGNELKIIESLLESQKNDISLYERIGGAETLSKAVEKFYEMQLSEQKVKHLFLNVNMDKLIKMQKAYLSKLFGGPDFYIGKNLEEGHQHLKLSNNHFDVSKENLIIAFKEVGVSSFLCNEIGRLFESGRKACVKSNKEKFEKVSLFERLGGSNAISTVVDLFYKKMLADPSIAPYFSATDMVRQHKMQKTFLTKLTGGPDNYVGRDLYSSHCHLKIKNKDFDTSKFYLEESMKELNVERELIRELSNLFESGRNACVQNAPVNDAKICLFEKLGGANVISLVVDLFYKKMLADTSIAHYFSATDMVRQHKMQKAFLTKLSGGPDNYVGRDLYSSHCHLKIKNKDFDKSKFYFEEAMEELKVDLDLIKEMSNLFESGRNACVENNNEINGKKKECLFERLGGASTISSLVDLFYKKMLADSSIADFFSATDMVRQHKMQKSFLTKLTGGPDNYVGRDLYSSHHHLKITNKDFDVSKIHFEEAMKDLNIDRELIQEMKNLFESGRPACIPTIFEDDLTFYGKIGGHKIISKAVDSFYSKQLGDPQIAHYFKNIDMERLHRMQKSFLSKVLGGPDNYHGKDLKSSHQHLNITHADFERSKNHFINSFKEAGVSSESILQDLVKVFESGRSECIIEKKFSIDLSHFKNERKETDKNSEKKESPTFLRPSIYERIGGAPAVSAAVDIFYQKQQADPRVKGFFKGIDLPKLHLNQKSFLTKVFGGPDNYAGRDLKSSHKGLKITEGQFEATVENLINTLYELKVGQDIIEEVKIILESTRSHCVGEGLEKAGSKKTKCSIEASKVNQNLFEKMGGKESINKLEDIIYKKMLMDKRVRGYFRGVDIEHLHTNQKAFLTKILAGPSKYSGYDLKATYEGLILNDEYFNVFLENVEPALIELHYTEDLIREIMSIFESTRNINLSQDNSNNSIVQPHRKLSPAFRKKPIVNITLFDRIGGKSKISTLVDLFYKRQLADPRVRGYFKGIDMPRLHQMQKYFLAKVTGGPDEYRGRDMISSHISLKLPNCHFDAVKENLLYSALEVGLDREIVDEIGKLAESVRTACVYFGFALLDQIVQENKEVGKYLFDKFFNEKERLRGFLNVPESVERSEILLSHFICVDKDSRKQFCKEYLHQIPNKLHLELVKATIFEGLFNAKIGQHTINMCGKRIDDSISDLVELSTNIIENIQKITEPKTLFLKLGGLETLGKIVENFYLKQIADPKVKEFYHPAELNKNFQNMKLYLTKLVGGPDLTSLTIFECDPVFKNNFEICKTNMLSTLPLLSFGYLQQEFDQLLTNLNFADKLKSTVTYSSTQIFSPTNDPPLNSFFPLNKSPKSITKGETNSSSKNLIIQEENAISNYSQLESNTLSYLNIQRGNPQNLQGANQLSKNLMSQGVSVSVEASQNFNKQMLFISLYDRMGGYKWVSNIVDFVYKDLESKGFFEKNEKNKQDQKFWVTKKLGGPDTLVGNENLWEGGGDWRSAVKKAVKEAGGREEEAEEVMKNLERNEEGS